MNWNRLDQANKVSDFCRNTDANGCHDQQTHAVEGELQRKTVADLLVNKHITESQRAFLLSLHFAKGHMLPMWAGERIGRIERYVEMAGNGRLPERDPVAAAAHAAAHQRAFHLRRAAQKDRAARSPRPDWMSDSSKLPKRPPGGRS